MTEIEAAVAAIPYEDAYGTPERYTDDAITACEQQVGRPLPPMLRWYLTNVGWRKLAYDHRSILVPDAAYLCLLAFEGADHQVFAQHHYEEYLTRNEGGLLPHDKAAYLPFGMLTGGRGRTASLRLLISLNDDDHGSIWAVKPFAFFGNWSPSQPLRLADDFAAFLRQIGPADRLGPVADANNEALFERLVDRYLASRTVEPTSAPTAEALMRTFFERYADMIFDGARNVEFQHRAYGHPYEDERAFAIDANRFGIELRATSAWMPGPLQRRDIRIGQPELFDRIYAYRTGEHRLRIVTIDSVVGDGHRLREEFLLHHDPDAASWTMLRRLEATIDDVRVKGVGTFTFDATEQWRLKKKIRPAWSELPATLHVAGDEGALTRARIAFVEDILRREDFKPILEAHVFDLYTRVAYPEFEAMPEEGRLARCLSAPERHEGHLAALRQAVRDLRRERPGLSPSGRLYLGHRAWADGPGPGLADRAVRRFSAARAGRPRRRPRARQR
ncbi:SMI1/KNR4 family protein [Methylobacterium iners]|uniref:Knr4/Smi1-like domain-containing protein n=1 Tax=Methylobacterium iners TaxID=418707 RepID=A0ABQ4S294_9HYPH|nr:SMI1/KNR4 family protein [Methylobacterium iners]GJD96044.1 hypothetical protein OCOJLMKI_3262 [Methylobacterium iners]